MSVNVNPIMAAIVEAAETLNTAPEDYINPDDGLKYCASATRPRKPISPNSTAKTGWTNTRLPVNARLRNKHSVKRNNESWNG